MKSAFIAFLAFITMASHGALSGMLEIGTVQIRATAPGMDVTGGYVAITNHGNRDDTLVATSALFAKRVELHEMTHVSGVMKMHRRGDGIGIPAGETVLLKPGGLHIMFIGLKETLQPGEMREITLEFASGHRMTVPAMVLKPGDIKAGGHGHSHDESDGHSGGHKHKHSHD